MGKLHSNIAWFNRFPVKESSKPCQFTILYLEMFLLHYKAYGYV